LNQSRSDAGWCICLTARVVFNGHDGDVSGRCADESIVKNICFIQKTADEFKSSAVLF